MIRPLARDQLTGRLLKAARALAGMSASDLAIASGLSVITIKRAEAVDGNLGLRAATSDSIVEALAARGVGFVAIDQPGYGAGVVFTARNAD